MSRVGFKGYNRSACHAGNVVCVDMTYIHSVLCTVSYHGGRQSQTRCTRNKRQEQRGKKQEAQEAGGIQGPMSTPFLAQSRITQSVNVTLAAFDTLGREYDTLEKL
jgi:hypothetical protein